MRQHAHCANEPPPRAGMPLQGPAVSTPESFHPPSNPVSGSVQRLSPPLHIHVATLCFPHPRPEGGAPTPKKTTVVAANPSTQTCPARECTTAHSRRSCTTTPTPFPVCLSADESRRAKPGPREGARRSRSRTAKQPLQTSLPGGAGLRAQQRPSLTAHALPLTLLHDSSVLPSITGGLVAISAGAIPHAFLVGCAT